MHLPLDYRMKAAFPLAEETFNISQEAPRSSQVPRFHGFHGIEWVREPDTKSHHELNPQNVCTHYLVN